VTTIREIASFGPFLGDVEKTLHMAAMPELWVVVLVLVPAVVAAVAFCYRRERGTLDRASRWTLAAIRVAILLLILFLLFHPIIETTIYQVRRPTLAVLIDDSASMQREDRYADPDTLRAVSDLAGVEDPAEVAGISRLELLRRVLTREEGKVLEELAGSNDLQVFAFATELREIGADRIDELRAKGNSTALGDAISGVLRQLRGRPLSGLVVFSDGRSNAGRDVEEAAVDAQNRPAPVPIFAVGVGDPDEPKDVGIEEVDAPEVILVNDEIIFNVTIRSKGFEGQRLTLTVSEDGRELASADLVLEGKNREQNALVYYRPTEPGLHSFELAVPVLEGEQYVENNRVIRRVNVIQRQIQILYVEGYPRWEYRYLKEALRRDDDTMKLNALLLSADPDFVQESSRGVPPLASFPKTREEIFEYDVILFGDVNPQELGSNPADVERILTDIRDFVEVGSGGFGVIAGENDSPRSFQGTPLESLLPVVIGDLEDSGLGFRQDTSVASRIRLTDVGMSDPIMILERDPEENRRRWEDEDWGLPGFFWYFPAKKAKAGARVLAVHPVHQNKYGPVPLVATQFYGSGRTFFTALDSSWRWRFLYGDRYFYRFWSQVIRYLATGRMYQFNPRFEIFCDKSKYVLGERVIVTAKVRDKNFEPSESPTQEVLLQPPGSVEPIALTLDREPSPPGTYTHSFLAEEVGTYRLRAPEDQESPDRQGRTVTFQVAIPSVEKENMSLDAGTLAVLARRTEGVYVPLSRLPELPDQIVPMPERVAGSRSREDLFDLGWRFLGITWNWALLLFAGLIVVEWVIRKRKRLL
jgi:hypothetical protein